MSDLKQNDQSDMPSSPASTVWVLVYGTLRRGQANDITQLRMANLPPAEFVTQIQLPGALFDLGWYPGYSDDPAYMDEAAQAVTVEVYRVPAALIVKLDEIEEINDSADSEYFKRWISLELDGHTRSCLLYQINPNRLGNGVLISSGDWVSYWAKKSGAQ
ncbi:gamma-glutamylcyclotransferase family protein [Ampullimonas aquatilis]|uniref:gamma-glutamylcyclotransferase family protein n=1 Tax=Ampullimonas aquatilis TaxID=1341549 RepID=UPI003C7687B0